MCPDYIYPALADDADATVIDAITRARSIARAGSISHARTAMGSRRGMRWPSRRLHPNRMPTFDAAAWHRRVAGAFALSVLLRNWRWHYERIDLNAALRDLGCAGPQ